MSLECFKLIIRVLKSGPCASNSEKYYTDVPVTISQCAGNSANVPVTSSKNCAGNSSIPCIGSRRELTAPVLQLYCYNQ